ncbi:MAG: hypothetical protein ACFFEF_06785 [Candidatus Thorarchaeota archaeon]
MTLILQKEASQVLSDERSKLRRPMYLSLLLIFLVMPLVLSVLQASEYGGTIDDTQLGFSAEIIKGHFSLMDTQGMMLFALGNLFDCLFILSYGTFFYNSTRYLSWNYRHGSIAKRIAVAFTWIGVTSATCDAIENAFLFLMLSNPLGFPSWLAIAHSLFATLKFLMMYATIGWLILSVVLNKTFFRNQVENEGRIT